MSLQSVGNYNASVQHLQKDKKKQKKKTSLNMDQHIMQEVHHQKPFRGLCSVSP